MAANQFNLRPPGQLCPFESRQWEALKRVQNCSKPEYYHCLPNQYNQPGQICVKANWVSKNYCPIFNTDANDMDLIPCDLQYGACSDTDFRSNEVYKYAGCLNKTSIIGVTTGKTPESSVQPLTIALAVIIPLIILLVLGLIVCVYCRRRKSRRYPGKDHEMEPFINKNNLPLGFYKTCDYLDNNVFCKTKRYEEAVGILKTYGCITLVGPPGSGKTMTAVQLARHICRNEEKAKLYFCQTLEEIIAAAESKEACIVADGCLDQYLYYPSKVNDDLKEFEGIFTDYVHPKKSHIIFTVQEDKWHALRDSFSGCGMFSQKHVLHINDNSFSLTDLENMIVNHLKYHKISLSSKEEDIKSETKYLQNEKMVVSRNAKQEIAKLLRQENQFSSPLIIDLICKNRRLMLSKHLILKDGFREILQKFFQKWSTAEDIDERESFCILVFVALRGGMVSLSDFKSTVVGPIYEEVCRQFNCRKSAESVKNLLKKDIRLAGCLFHVPDSTENDTYIFHHEWLLHFVLRFVTEIKNETFLIENANVDILLRKCWIKEGIVKQFFALIQNTKTDPPMESVCFSTFTLKELGRRIYSEMQKGYVLHDRLKHVFWSNELFLKEWDQICVKVDTCHSSESNRGDPKKAAYHNQDESKGGDATIKMSTQIESSNTKSKVTDSNTSEIERSKKEVPKTRSTVHVNDSKTEKSMETLTTPTEIAECTSTSTDLKVAESDLPENKVKLNSNRSSSSKPKSKTKKADTKKPTDASVNGNDSTQNASAQNNDHITTGTMRSDLTQSSSIKGTSRQTNEPFDGGSAV
ncbi:uncharacterized protein LOC125683448 isoform X2 [Ostrea edulis]|nr:uncharacterized protein LOC125683448 isoform X2 [Ostrea edulis]